MLSILTTTMESEGVAGGSRKSYDGIEAGGVGNEVVRVEGMGEAGSSKLQEKIDVVLQILTMLETTMASAEGAHEKKKSDYMFRINQLQLEIDKLRQEMSLDEEKFRDVSKTLGSCIRVYMASENILRTVEERSQNDNIVLPDLDPKTDSLIGRYLGEKQDNWRRLRLQREKLNNETEKSGYQKDLRVRRFRIAIPVTAANQVNQRVLEAANALNTFRGKKVISGSKAYAIERFFTVTCYKNDYDAVNYVENNYSKVLNDVIKKQYNCSETASLVINELAIGEDFDHASVMETTIHVQPKPKDNSDFAAPGTPKRITLYQFDHRSPRRQSQVTTFNVETAAITNVNDDSSSEISPSPQCETSQIPVQSIQPSFKELFPASFKQVPRLSQGQQQQIAAKTSQLLDSFIGLDLDDGNKAHGMTENNNTPVPDDNRSEQINENLQQPFQPQANMVSDSDEDDVKQVDGVVLHEWAGFFVEQKGITRFTETQKELLDSFKLQGDILYKGVTNSGKTTATILGLVNNLEADLFKPQALVITPNARASKLIRKLANIEAGHYMILCRRFEELIGQKDKSKITIKRPSCQVVVGSAEEMCDLTSRGLVNAELIKYLVLYKVDEIVGPESIRKSIFKSIRKLLYTLSATVKVIVICKTSAKMSKEMQELCNSKLRSKIMLEEKMDVEEFLQGRQRIKSGDKIQSCVKQVSGQPLAKSASSHDRIISSGSFKRQQTPPSSSQTDRPNNGSKIISKDVRIEEKIQCRTFIPLEAVQMLGLNVGRYQQNSESDLIEVAHFYANVENGSDYSKADVISMLDLEEDKAIIFCNSIDKTEWLSTILRQKHLWPQVLHEQVAAKDQRVILEHFRQGTFCRVLICTDFLLSFSFDSADVVLNFDLPETQTLYLNRAAFAFRQINFSKSDTDFNTQRERKGIVVSLITNDEITFINDLESDIGLKIQNCED